MKKIILLASLAFNINAIAQVPSYVPTNGLVGFWPFSGNANDQSSNGYNGTVVGATLDTDRFGNANKAYTFDGVNDSIKLNLQQSNITAYSISGWFKTSVGGPILAGRGLSNQTGLTLHIHNVPTGGSGQAGKAMFVADGAPISVGKTTVPTYNDNQWHHIVGVFNGTTGAISPSQFQIYVDNILISQTTNNTTGSASAPVSNSTNLLIGAHQVWPNGGIFNGKLDDIGVWNRALTITEINDLYNGNLCYQYITVTDTLLINTTLTGFNPVTYQNTIKIWPNPANDHITIDNGNIANLTGYQIKITNSLSQQVFQSAITQQQFYVDLSTWTGNGIYFVHIIDGQGNTIDIKKIILQ